MWRKYFFRQKSILQCIIFQTSNDVFKLGYEERFFDFMQDCIIEVERRIKRNKQRLDTNKDDDGVVNPVS